MDMECEPSTSQSSESTPLTQGRKRKTHNSPNESTKRPRDNHTNELNDHPEDSRLPGKILRVFVRNFMCHDALEVKLNKKVNFIVGANGSGKSAILTALTVGLGARANVTNRGGQIKNFIKTGKTSATVEISISNEGPLAFKHEVYGDVITVVRHISSSSSYKIKNWRGEVVGTRKEDLENIVNFLNIQVDNPISVLNQDTSRDFLAATSSSGKYQLFMQATRLSDIGENYKKAIESSEEAQRELNEANKYLNEQKKDINKLEKRLNAIKSLDGIKSEHENMNNELKWAKVIQEEKKLLELDLKIQSQVKKIEDLKNSEVAKISKEKEIDYSEEVTKQKIKEIEAEAKDSQDTLDEIKREHAEKKRVNDELKAQVRATHAEIIRKSKDVDNLKEFIKTKENENSKAGQNREQAQQALMRHEQDIEEVEATLKTKQNELMHMEEGKSRLVQEEYALRNEVQSRDVLINNLKREMHSLRNKSNDANMVYGPNMPKLLRRIQEEAKKNKFKKVPKGPIGAFIKVKDPSWIPAIESQLGGYMTSFCVDNIQDARVLNIIMEEVFHDPKAKPQVIISKFFDRVHDIANNCSRSSKYRNLFEAMEISDPVVANNLIDQTGLECTLLIDTSEEASSIMAYENLVPKNCKKAFTKKGDIFFPDPAYRTYGGTVRRPKYLQVSTSDAIRDLQDDISKAEEEHNEFNKKWLKLKEKIKSTDLELREVKEYVRKLVLAQQKLRDEIDKFKEILEVKNDGQLEMFITELQELQKKVEEEKEEEKHMLEKTRGAQKQVDNLYEEIKRRRNLIQNIDSKLQPLNDKIRELQDEKKNLRISNQGITKMINENKLKLQQSRGEQEQQQRVVSRMLQEVESICPRIETNRNIHEIEMQMQELKAHISAIEKENGSMEQIIMELNDKRNSFSEVHKYSIDLEDSNQKQLIRLKDRKQFFEEMKKVISTKVQTAFSNILSLRNYKGKIKIDHKNKSLDLEVSQKNDAKRPTKDIRSLSGGEKSYSTVALILALWDCTGVPFYFLDEFDVFMDKINRRLIMDILLDYAKNHPKSQFAFLTPLDTGHIVPDHNISVHKLSPPRS